MAEKDLSCGVMLRIAERKERRLKNAFYFLIVSVLFLAGSVTFNLPKLFEKISETELRAILNEFNINPLVLSNSNISRSFSKLLMAVEKDHLFFVFLSFFLAFLLFQKIKLAMTNREIKEANLYKANLYKRLKSLSGFSKGETHNLSFDKVSRFKEYFPDTTISINKTRFNIFSPDFDKSPFEEIQSSVEAEEKSDDFSGEHPRIFSAERRSPTRNARSLSVLAHKRPRKILPSYNSRREPKSFSLHSKKIKN